MEHGLGVPSQAGRTDLDAGPAGGQAGPDADMAEAVLAAHVQQHEIASTISLT